MRAAPALSVVVAATDSAEAASRCVASLGLGGRRDVQVIVAGSRARLGSAPAIAGAEWAEGEPGASAARLRRLGLDRARAKVVAFTEDSCRLDPGWADAWLAAFRMPDLRAATGPVEHAPGGSAVDWAVFFCEYAPFLASRSPAGDGPPRRLAGNNFAASRDWLSARLPAGDDVQEWRLAGPGAVAVRGARAWHVRRETLRSALRDRVRFGLEYGRLRASEGPSWCRGLATLAGPAILASQVARLVVTLARKRRHRARLVATLPPTLLLLAAWSLGEWWGWASGPPAPSRARAARLLSRRGA